MTVTQLSVFLENKPGHLEQSLAILADRGINIISLTIADTSDFGVLRALTSDSVQAAETLRAHQFTCSVTEVLAMEVEDRPGALVEVLRTVSDAGLNIEYMYTWNERRSDKAMMIFRFDRIAQARQVLEAKGYCVLQRNDILGE
jgi:hypothetical protein